MATPGWPGLPGTPRQKRRLRRGMLIGTICLGLGAALLGALLPNPRDNMWLKIYIVAAPISFNLVIAVWAIRIRGR